MAPVIDSPTSDALEGSDLTLRWSGQISLTRRILAVNILALLLLAGGFFYLDSFRSRLIDSRVAQSLREARLIGEAITAGGTRRRDELVVRLAQDSGVLVRLYDNRNTLIADSRALGVRNFVLADPDKDDWGQGVARFLDASIDTVVGAPRAPLYRERRNGAGWPDASAARDGKIIAATVWRAPDRTPVITAASPIGDDGVVLTAVNARDITQTVRVERFRLGMVLLVATLVSVLLSLFLARTIVRPIRRLARAAVRVRLGRAREVVVPRLPDRRDEIGSLARALSDMSLALRARIDAIEAFAADVTHELKNPLASLRSAVDGLARVSDPALQASLLGIVRDDVRRLDRLITDIAEASRLDAQLSRATFEPIDVAAVLAGLLGQREERGHERGVRIRFDRAGDGPFTVLGEGARLERVFENLLDNAVSFSPDGGLVTVAAARERDTLVVRVEDEGAGVPENARETIFRRFQSIRPDTEAFGQHSGLGLAIARTIVEGHQGQVTAESREDRLTGARFVVRLPLMGPRAGARVAEPPVTLHATTVAIGGAAVVIEGASGDGKSDLAMRLIDRGAVLVSDDRTTLARDGDRLIARAPVRMAGRMEVRGLGIVSVPHTGDVPVALLVRVGGEDERLPARRERAIAGVTLRELSVDAFRPSAAIKVEWALSRPELPA